MIKLNWIAGVRKVSELKELERNPRKITEEAFERLVERINKRGFHDVIKLDTEDNILSGNQRRKALVRAGIEEVNTLTPNRKLTAEEKKAIVVESNRSDGFFDFDILSADYNSEELAELGFSARELDMVDFPELDGVDFMEEADPEEQKKYELIFSSIDDYKEFSNLARKIQNDIYPESSISDSLLKYLRNERA
jgi:hypothetical protein